MSPAPATSSRARAVDLRVAGLAKSYGPVPAVRGIDLDVPAGTMVSLIGPSGCGKTTTLRMIAGLERADAGEIRAGERLLTTGSRSVPPEQRDMGMVFQSYALWPHMTVAANVAYGLKRRGRPREDVEPKVAEVLGIVGMGGYKERYPAQLSGGQQQRVALARAIATEPSILLFDEPLSNLDAVLREQMRFEIRSLQQRIGITAVYVTHSQDEALVLSDQIAVMRDGVIVQRGAPMDIYRTPRSSFVATFIGLANLLPVDRLAARGSGWIGRLANGTSVLADVRAEGTGLSANGKGIFSVRPVDMRVVAADRLPTSGDDAVNRVPGTVESVAFAGGLADAFIAPEGSSDARLRVQAPPPIAFEPGQRVIVEFPSSATVAMAD